MNHLRGIAQQRQRQFETEALGDAFTQQIFQNQPQPTDQQHHAQHLGQVRLTIDQQETGDPRAEAE